jgi:chromosome segregation protein
VHLRAIKLRGFKSFPDAVEVRLEPGVTVVVGPNGSGKSNVADAIVWASGSQSPSELRAERADDVLFAGGKGREPAGFCEVELVLDNEDGGLESLEFAEVSLARRLHRGGEGQYLVNRTPVRRIDLVELLADVGLGGGAGAIVGQGKVEAILASRPEERRALVEEAAGLGRFKRRRHRAELKLARVAVQVDRARDLEAEVTKHLRPLALQATAAERAERLGAEIAVLRATLASLDLEELGARLTAGEERRLAASLERKRVGEALEALLREREAAEEELADAAGSREAATAALYRLRSTRERLDLRRESAAELLAKLRQEAADAGEATPAAGPTPEELEREAQSTAAEARAAAVERDSLRERAQLTRERLAALERSLAEREGLPPAARALAEQGERLALAELEVEPGQERAVAAALGHRGSALLADDPRSALTLVERARAAGLGGLTVLVGRDPASLVAELPVVAKEDLLRSTVPAVTAEGFGYDPQRGELWFVGEAAEAVLLELEARRRALEGELAELEVAAGRAVAQAEALDERARAAGAAFARIGRAAMLRRADPRMLRALAGATERLVTVLEHATGASARFEAPLRARVDAGGARTGELAAELRRLGAAEAEARRVSAEAGERAAAVEVELARLEGEAANARRRLEEAGAAPGEAAPRDELLAKLERLERRREALGGVNPLAKEEYEREKERLAELREQCEDLERSLAELQGLRDELAETVERRFEETFAAVSENFREVAATLFPDGEGRLRLTEPDPEEEDGQPGIEVELRPAGKRVTRLSLLSGGEKALGAIAFLFSLFLARPCPFYLLDEVEAALDDTNIGRFVELLRRYADRAQFIVITHQKRTMDAADVLYGVTMAGDGISQIVSRRMTRDAPALAG